MGKEKLHADQRIRTLKKVAFALTSKGSDVYSLMTRLAIISIRLTNPDILITVACDKTTDENIKKNKDPILNEVDEWLPVNTPDGEDGFRNRFVKTSLRNILAGPFLFLDSDVLVRADLSLIFQVEADIAGARNHSKASLEDQIWEEDKKFLDIMDWQTSSLAYINGGVIFYNDTPKAFEFGYDWHRKWLKGWNINSRFRDQPSLNAALHETKVKFFLLPDKYNAQIKTNTRTSWKAAIWHYYFSENSQPETSIESLIKNRATLGIMLNDRIKNLISQKHPWRERGILDQIVIQKIRIQGYRNEFDKLWLSGAKRKAFLTNLAKIRNILPW